MLPSLPGSLSARGHPGHGALGAPTYSRSSPFRDARASPWGSVVPTGRRARASGAPTTKKGPFCKKIEATGKGYSLIFCRTLLLNARAPYGTFSAGCRASSGAFPSATLDKLSLPIITARLLVVKQKFSLECAARAHRARAWWSRKRNASPSAPFPLGMCLKPKRPERTPTYSRRFDPGAVSHRLSRARRGEGDPAALPSGRLHDYSNRRNEGGGRRESPAPRNGEELCIW